MWFFPRENQFNFEYYKYYLIDFNKYYARECIQFLFYKKVIKNIDIHFIILAVRINICHIFNDVKYFCVEKYWTLRTFLHNKSI